MLLQKDSVVKNIKIIGPNENNLTFLALSLPPTPHTVTLALKSVGISVLS